MKESPSLDQFWFWSSQINWIKSTFKMFNHSYIGMRWLYFRVMVSWNKIQDEMSSSLPLSISKSIFPSSCLWWNVFFPPITNLFFVLVIEIRFSTSQISLLCLSLTFKWPLLLNNQYWNEKNIDAHFFSSIHLIVIDVNVKHHLLMNGLHP